MAVSITILSFLRTSFMQFAYPFVPINFFSYRRGDRCFVIENVNIVENYNIKMNKITGNPSSQASSRAVWCLMQCGVGHPTGKAVPGLAAWATQRRPSPPFRHLGTALRHSQEPVSQKAPGRLPFVFP